MKFAIIVFAFTALIIQNVLCVFVEKSTGERVLDGANADIADMPWVVALTVQGYNSSAIIKRPCVGTIISERQILTAAACFYESGSAMTGVRITMGRNSLLDVTEGGEIISFTAFKGVVVHETYTEKNNVDNIAIINLPHNLTLGDKINKIDLPAGDAGVVVDDPVTISGWGDDQTDDNVNDLLQTGELLYSSKSVCSQYNDYWVEKNVLCLSIYAPDGQITKAGKADIGAPVVYNHPAEGNILFGIVTTTTIDTGTPVYGTKISGYLDWIASHAPQE